jgi:ParB/RepB/Spo0J family partition protein
VGSIKTDGLLNPIVVCSRTDDQSGEAFYELVDGVQRYNACLDCGFETVPANVIANASEAAMLRKQIVGNIHRIETRPVEYSKHLQKVLALDPLLTVAQLASQLNKSTAWISQRMGLLHLDKKVADLVDEGKINLSNAYALARLPVEEQASFVDQAMTETPGEFVPKMADRKKELDKARREGREVSPIDFVPVARYQKMAETKAEIESAALATILVNQCSITDPIEAFTLGVKWCLHLDPLSVAEGRRQWEAKQAAINEKKDSAKADRMAKRADEATTKAARIKLEAELIKAGKSEEEIIATLVDFDLKNKSKSK